MYPGSGLRDTIVGDKGNGDQKGVGFGDGLPREEPNECGGWSTRMLSDRRIRIAVGAFLGAVFLGLLSLGWPAERGSFVSHEGPTAAGEIVVQFRADLSVEQQASVLNAHGATLERSMLVEGYAVANVPAGSEDTIGQALAESGVVSSAEDNPVRFPAAAPDDPYYSQQWNMPLIGLDAARELSDGSGVTVAVVDTGVAYENYYDASSSTGYGQAPDLAETAIFSACDMWVTPAPDSFNCLDTHANDDFGHGSHVAGTIAQNTDNGYGTAGIAPKAKIMPIKVCGPEVIDATTNPPKRQEQCSDDKTADGVTYAVDNGANIINLSIAGTAQVNNALRDALTYAQDAGVIVIAAAGNAGDPTLQYPAAVNGVIAVGAVGQSKARASYSNYGQGETLPGLSAHTLDLVAPGGTSAEGATSVIWQQTYEKCTLNLNAPVDYTVFQQATPCRGTSVAAAHVSGVAALVKSKFPNLSRVQLTDVLGCSAENVGPSFEFGAGLVRADRALVNTDNDDLPDCIEPIVVTPRPTPIPPDNQCLSASISPTPAPTETPVLTETPVSTDTPLPSDTPTATPTPAPTPSPTPKPKCGDVDCNHQVNAMDALGVLQWLTESASSWSGCIGLGYVNCDAQLDVIDASVILRHSATLPTNVPAGCSGIG